MADFQTAIDDAPWRHEYDPRVLPNHWLGLVIAGDLHLLAGRYGQGCHRFGFAHRGHGFAGYGYVAGAGSGVAHYSVDVDQPVATGAGWAFTSVVQTTVAAADDDFHRHRPGHDAVGMSGGHSMTRALGGALLLYALSGLFLPTLRVKASWEPWLGPLCGLITGVITSATGVFVIPAVPYLQALGLDRNPLVQALGLSFTVSTLALAAGLFWNGALGGGELGASLFALMPALLGMAIGQWLRQRISALWFKRVFFVGMGALGLNLLIGG